MDEDRATDDNQRGDALRPRPHPAGGDDAAAEHDSLPASVRRRLDSCAADWLREHMLDVGGEAVRRWPWSPTGSAPGVTGDVVWDNKQQMGFLTFAGLEANSPLRHQYQLWIVDSARDERYPVDGGVFDVPAAAGPVVIPVRATVPVREPLAFVVTVEKPGGAVVSGRERVVAVARPAVN